MTDFPRWIPHPEGTSGYLILNEDLPADATGMESIRRRRSGTSHPTGTVHGILIRGIPKPEDPD